MIVDGNLHWRSGATYRYRKGEVRGAWFSVAARMVVHQDHRRSAQLDRAGNSPRLDRDGDGIGCE